MNSQVVVLKDAVDLLGGLLEAWRGSLAGSEARNIRRSYINRHAWHIHAIGGDVLVLAAAGRLGSIYLLSRPALESLFKLAAAVADEGFAAEKVVAEVEEEVGRIGHWLASAGPELAPTLKEMIKVLREFGDDFGKRHGVVPQGKWKYTSQVAKRGDLVAEYVRDYFIGSTHVHAMLSALTAREGGLYVPEGVYRLTVTITDAIGLVNKALMDLENGVAPGVFERALEIRRRARAAYDAVSGAQVAALRAEGWIPEQKV